LTPAAIQHLTVLASNQLHPSSELLKTWTTLLASSGVIEEDVINWIHFRNQEQPLQIPTPSDSPMTPCKQETSSPVMLPVALPLEHPEPDEHEARTTPSEPSPTSPISNIELNQCIIHGVRDALASPQTTTNVAPKTAAEFEASFSPFEQQISRLLHTLVSTQIGTPIDQQ
jgi:hypothetical protein